MSTVSLQTLCSRYPPVDAIASGEDRLVILVSDAADPMVPDRKAATVTLDWTGEAVVSAELAGAQRFIEAVPPQGNEAAPVVCVATAGGALTRIDARGRISHGRVVDEEDGPLFYGRLCASLTTRSDWYLGGMSRQLYRSDRAGMAWTRADEETLDEALASEHAAFYGLSEAGDGNLVAVGGGGEIWVREAPRPGSGQAGRWRTIESGTDVMLNAVTPVPGHGHAMCGAAGLLLNLRNDSEVSVIEHAIGAEFLAAVTVFGGSMFVAAPSGLHRWLYEGAFRHVGPIEGSRGAHLLVRGAGVLWLVGPDRIGRTVDGETWVWKDTSQFTVGPQA
jgi:hypothetical protein